MPHDFTSDRGAQTRRDHVLIAPNKAHHTLSRPDGYVITRCNVYAPNWGFLERGTVVEWVDGYVRLGGYTTPTLILGGTEFPARLLCEPYMPPEREMVVSPATGQLVPASSGTGKRALAWRVK
jgi:hypothetical protein